MDAPDDENSFLCFHFAGYFSYELPVARINFTRFQRAPEGAHHSTGGCGDYVVDRRSMGFFQFGRIDFVMFGDRAMDAEDDRLRFSGQISYAKRADFPLDSNFRNIDYVGHWLPPGRSHNSLAAAALLVANIFRSPLPIEGQHLQLPLDRHRRRQKANLTIASLIFELPCNRDCFSVGAQRIAEIRCGGQLQILGYAECTLENRNVSP